MCTRVTDEIPGFAGLASSIPELLLQIRGLRRRAGLNQVPQQQLVEVCSSQATNIAIVTRLSSRTPANPNPESLTLNPHRQPSTVNRKP